MDEPLASSSNGRSLAVDTLMDRSSGLVVINGLPGSGREDLVARWLSRHSLGPAGHIWINTAQTKPTDISVEAGSTVMIFDRVADDADGSWADTVSGLVRTGAHVVVLTDHRSEFRAPLVDRTSIGPMDLAWGATEVRARMGERGLNASDAVIVELVAQTGGWAVLIAEAIEAYRAGSKVDDVSAGLSRASMYFASQLAPEFDFSTDIQFWRALSLDTQLNVDVLAALTEADTQGGDNVRRAVQIGLVTLEGDRQSPAVALIPLVREYVHRGAWRDDPQSMASLHSRLSSLHAERGAASQALRHADIAGDDELKAQTLDTFWPYVLAEEGMDALRVHVAGLRVHGGALPFGTSRLAELFELRTLAAVERSVPGIEGDVMQLAGTQPGNALLRDAIASMMVHRKLGRMDLAVRLADRLDPLALAMRDSSHSPAGLSPFWHLQAGITRILNYDHFGAVASLERAWNDRDRDGLGFVGRAASRRLALLRLMQGLSQDAAMWFERGLAEPKPGAIADWVDAPTLVYRHVRAVDQLDLATAIMIDDAGFAPPDVDELWPFRLYAQVQRLINMDELARAMLLIEETVAAAGGTPEGLRHALPLTIRAHYMLYADKAAAAVELHFMSDQNLYDLLVESRIKVLAGEFEVGLRFADRGISETLLHPRTRLAFMATGVAACAAMGDTSATRARLSELLEAAHRIDILVALTELPRSTLEDNVDLPGVADVLARLDLSGIGPFSWPDSADLVRLTDRERVILRATAEFSSVRKIAEHLMVSTNTVKTQQRSLYRKLGVTARDEAVRKARQLGHLL